MKRFKRFLGVDLQHIVKVKLKPGETGYSLDFPRSLDHHFLDVSAEVKLYDVSLPMAIVNISSNPILPIVCHVSEAYRENIEVVESPPDRYEKIILIYFDPEPEPADFH